MLRRYGILDTDPELAFDDLARIAALICGTPISAISLIDSERQWFKASVGLSVTETPREQAFCAHAIKVPNDTLIVPDARRDPRFADNPLVTGELGIRFYAGAPLVTSEGHGLGSLCVIDTQPRTLSDEQIAALKALARMVMGQLELRRNLGVLSVAFAEREVAVAAARDYEERFRLAFEKASVGMTLTSPDGRLLSVNERYCRLVGRSAEELCGLHFVELNDPERVEAELRVQQRLLAGEVQSLVREKPYPRPDGGVSWGLVTTSLVRSLEGAPLYFASQVEDVTERKLAEQALRQTQSIGDAIVSADERSRITAWNPAAEALFGWPQDEVLGKPLALIMPARHRDAHARGFAASMRAESAPLGGRAVEIEAVHRDGTERWIELSVGRTRSHAAVSFTAVIRDISERRAAADALRKEAAHVELLRSVAVAANEATSPEEAMRRVLERVCAMTGWSLGHVLEPEPGGGVRSSGVWWSQDPARFEAFRSLTERLRFGLRDGPGTVLRTGAPTFQADIADDDERPRVCAGRRAGLRAGGAFPVRAGDEVVAVLEFFADVPFEPDVALLEVMSQVGTQLGRVIERRRAEDRVAHQSLHDPLTDLPNRTLLQDRTRQLAAAAARSGQPWATLVVDLDRFRLVNDRHGHAVGDELIVRAAQRLTAVVRNHDTVARIGGDEFVVVCGPLAEPDEAVRLAHRLVESFARPFALPAGESFVSASVGVALGEGSDDPEVVLRDADAAMYRAKDRGRNRFELFDRHLGARAARRAAIDMDLHRALERGEFRLLYQPTLTMLNGRLEGVEALLRWHHPERGVVSPGEFVPLLEENGLIEPVGAWVLQEACAQLGRWRAAAAPATTLRMAVNLSARQLNQPDLAAVVAHALAAAAVPADRLTLEITETAVMQDTTATLAQLQQLRGLGVQLAVDDFGTGYSSLAYLHRLPIDILKIDRSFIASLGADSQGAIVDAIVHMGHALGLVVLAEGIETEAQAAYLCRRGCDLGQGFLFARPLQPEAITERLVAARVG